MGDEVDGLDLPIHEQSGNMSRGQISELNERELQEQSGALDTVLENYYTGGTNFNQVLTEITNLGYTEDRARQIRQSAQTERTIRSQTGHPSDLTPNQLRFLQRNHQVLQYDNFEIHTDSDGRSYIDDPRVRELDGRPSKLYLPAPEEFNPLTIAQQQEQQERLEQARPDFLQDFELFTSANVDYLTRQRLPQDFNNRDRSIIDSELTNYLNNPSQESLNRMRENVGLFIRPNTIRNQNDILNQFFVDIQYEAEFRRNNNGRPQLLSEEQYNLLNTDSSLNWDGGAIYENDRGEIYYRDSVRGIQRAVPSLDADGEVTYPLLASNINLPPSITGIYRGQFSPETYDPQFNIRPPRENLTPEQQERLQQDIADVINGNKNYSDFLVNLQNNYSLSNQQFIDASLAVSERKNDLTYEDILRTQSYIDSPLYFYTDENGNERFTTSQRVYSQLASSRGISQEIIDRQIATFDRDFQVSHTAQQTALTITPAVQPSLNVLEQIRQGLTTQEEIDNRFLERPQPFQQTSRSRDILNQLTQGSLTRENVIPKPDVIFMGSSGNPPIVAGQTEPILPTGEPLEVPLPAEQIERYRQFFNSRQNEFTPFRNMFRDLLPVFGGAAGGYFAFSLARSRERGTIQEIINQERQLLDRLDIRIQDDIDRLDDISFRVQDNSDFDPVRDPDDDPVRQVIEMTPLRNLPTTLRTEASELQQRFQAGTGEFEFLTQSSAPEFLRNQLKQIDEAIQQAESDLDSLEMDIASGRLNRQQINTKLDNLIDLDRQILNDVYRYNPQILTGITIGTTLGLVLSGYFFPTYIDIDDDNEFITADNINYNPDDLKKKKEERDKRKKSHKPKQQPDLTSQKLVPNDNISIRKAPEIVRSFIPQKSNKNGTPLSYRQIQEYKSLLTPNELNKIKGKVLMFNESNKVVPKSGNKCLSVVGTNIINKIPVKI